MPLAPLLYRKTACDFVLGLLASNFNQTMNAFADAYNTMPFTLDFSTASTNFTVSILDPKNIEVCQIQWSDTIAVGGCLYTGDVINKGGPKQWNIAARMFVHLDLYVRDRTGVEGFNTENYFSAIEDCATAILQDETVKWPPGVIFTRDWDATREGLVPLGDGFFMRIPMKFLFEIYVN